MIGGGRLGLPLGISGSDFLGRGHLFGDLEGVGGDSRLFYFHIASILID